MDYLVFGLVAGSLIVIASFVVRDALPHLSAIGSDSRLARLSRAASPSAWGRWCADVGLVLAGAGTLVLLITVAAVLFDLSDDAGNVLVGLSVAAAVVASVLAAARLAQRPRMDVERVPRAEPLPVTSAPVRSSEEPVHSTKPVVVVARPDEAAPQAMEPSTGQPGDVWDDDLPTWPPSTPESQRTSGWTVAEVSPNHEEDVETLDVPRARGWTAAAAEVATPNAPVGSGGLFSSPLLADIGLSADEEADDRYRSPLLSDLHDGPFDNGADAHVDRDTGSDLLLDEAPAPVGSSGRPRDGVDDR